MIAPYAILVFILNQSILSTAKSIEKSINIYNIRVIKRPPLYLYFKIDCLCGMSLKIVLLLKAMPGVVAYVNRLWK
jgi:hypothetical protein